MKTKIKKDIESTRKEIKEIQNYFKSKIANGDFELLEVTECTVKITIEEFVFKLWLSNGVNFFNTYDGSLMHLSFNDDEREVCYNVLYPIYVKELNGALDIKINELEKKKL